ncbi:cell division protein FtsB [Anaerosolibacter carboniphilus]|uniref:Cell division protein FtsB n=2 Tax=Anaerosolibacter carboniphilus TaxID=1417629 RepID=A0A841KM67_9FIRM|nr:cell division protein FtsB [Anaerosolibacter carboniphilus]
MMKRRKAVWVLTFFGILLMLSFIILGGALVEQCARLNGIYSMQKVLVSGKNQADLQGKNSFSIDDIKRLKKELSTKYISYTARSSLVDPSVSSGSMVFPFRLIGTDYMYPMFSGLSLEEGSFITQKQEEEGAMVAIIDEELAWDVFRTKNATGKIIDIFGAAFRIIGVMEKEDSIIGKLTDDGLPEVYIPASVMLELDTTARITDLQIKTADANTLDQNTTDVSAAIRQIGKDPSSYNISDYNLKLALMKQKPLLLVFILGIASMLILLSHVKNLIKEIYFLIRDRCKTDYFSNVIKHNLKGIGFRILEMALSLTGIVLIWIGIRFTLYIPPQNIPDELINISYYSDLIKAAIQEGIQNRGYVAPQAELIVNASDMLLNLFFCISFILGFLLFYEGLRELKELNMNSSKLIPVLGLLFILSMGILTAAAFLSGLPYGTDVKGVLVAWAFIYVNFIITRKESGVKNV